MINGFTEKRSEPRTTVDEYNSVEFSIKDTLYVYQFKLWNISSKGICVVVKEDSDIIKYLKVGEIMDLRYHKSDSSKQSEYLKTEIMHITKEDRERFKGHYLVGLSISENQNTN